MSERLENFLERLAEVLEVPSVALGDDFRTVPMWSSLVGFSVMLMFDLEYGLELTASELKAATTVADLAKKAGVFDPAENA